MLQGELDHLPYPHQLLVEASDVLVRDGGCENLSLLDGLLLHLDEGLLGDLDGPPGHGPYDHEGKGSSHEGDAGDDDHVPLHHRPLQQAPLHEVLYPLAETDLMALTYDRGYGHPLGLLNLGLLNLHLVTNGNSQVAADEPVNSDDALALVLLHGTEELRRGGLLADDLDNLPHVDSQGHSRAGVNPGPAESDIRLRRLCNFENYPVRHRL